MTDYLSILNNELEEEKIEIKTKKNEDKEKTLPILEKSHLNTTSDNNSDNEIINKKLKKEAYIIELDKLKIEINFLINLYIATRPKFTEKYLDMAMNDLCDNNKFNALIEEASKKKENYKVFRYYILGLFKQFFEIIQKNKVIQYKILAYL